MINPETVDKYNIHDVSVNGLDLSLIHESILQLTVNGELPKLIDGSEWFTSFNKGPKDYYISIFLSLTGKVFLFEDFLTHKNERPFYESVVKPAFAKAAEILGHAPNVVPLCLGHRSSSPLWYAYPDHYRKHFESLGVQL